jgi:putative transposase
MSPDHVHLLISVSQGVSISRVVQYIKGKGSRKLQQEFEQLRKRYWEQHLWAREYFVVTVGNVNEEDVQKYIENQEIYHKTDNFKISEF